MTMVMRSCLPRTPIVQDLLHFLQVQHLIRAIERGGRGEGEVRGERGGETKIDILHKALFELSMEIG